MKKLILSLIIISSLLTTACWDMREINQMIFPYSVGLDPDEENESSYETILAYPNIHSLGAEPTSEEKTFLISEKGQSIFQAIANLTTTTNQPVGLRHLRVLAISKDLAEEKGVILEIIDGANRDFRMNQMVELLIVEDSVKDFMEVKTKSERQETKEGGIYSILKNRQGSSRFLSKTLNEFIDDMDCAGASTLPLGRISGDEIAIEGVAVFKDFKLVGQLNGDQTTSIRMLIDGVGTDEINGKYKGKNFSLEIINIKHKKKLIGSDKKLKIRYTANIKAQINEYTMMDHRDLDEEEVIRGMEKAAEKKLSKEIKASLNQLQKELKADIIDSRKYLERFHPKVWKKIKDDWEKEFPNLDIDLDINVNIRRRGLTS